jgi:hypothetical protein
LVFNQLAPGLVVEKVADLPRRNRNVLEARVQRVQQTHSSKRNTSRIGQNGHGDLFLRYLRMDHWPQKVYNRQTAIRFRLFRQRPTLLTH